MGELRNRRDRLYFYVSIVSQNPDLLGKVGWGRGSNTALSFGFLFSIYLEGQIRTGTARKCLQSPVTGGKLKEV